MKVKDLIAELNKLPQDADVFKEDTEGCNECNYFRSSNYNEVYRAELHEGNSPRSKQKGKGWVSL